MTSHQVQLIDAEISRHSPLALIAAEPKIKSGHMEVAEALTAALAMAAERRSKKCRHHTLVTPTGLCLRPLKAKQTARGLDGSRRCHGP